MHVSLDSALGRQRRLNQVGETISSIAAPAAAYSLRSLTGGDPKVVRVRRGSDNDEQDFTASEVASGAMLSYVNTQAIKPLDIRELTSGGSDDGRNGNFILANAAYSLRSLGTRQATVTSSGDTAGNTSGKYVVQVRRNVNGDQKSFTADEVTDGTLLSFVNESFTSSLPLDVQGSAAAAYSLRNLSSSYSGNVVEVRRSSNNDTQNFTANEVTDGTLLSFVNEDVITEQSDFTSGTDSYTKDSHGTTSREATYEGKSDVLKYEFASTGRFGIRKTSIALDLTSSYTISFEYYADSEYNGKFWGIEDSFASRVSASSNSPTVVSGAWTSVTLNVPSGRATGISTLHIRMQDAASDTGGLTGITANVRFKNIVVTQLTGSGFVETWYDQSGNTNHATASTANQPKIVENGALLNLDSDGIPAVDFDDGKYMVFSSISAKTVVGVNHLTSTTNLSYLVGKNLGDGGVRTGSGNGTFQGADCPSSQSADFNNAGGTTHMNSSQTSFLATSKNVYFGTATSGNALTSIGTGFSHAGSSRSWRGRISEIIIYDSDQSEDRRAIEESISGHYGITLDTFNRNGFVRTWYDQSVTGQDATTGTPNANHAVQTSVSKMPTIVSNGSLITGEGIDFDDDQLDFTALNATDLAIFSVVKFDNVSGQERILGEDSTFAEGFGIAGHATGFFKGNGGSASQPALNVTLSATNDTLYSLNRASNTVGFFSNGVASATATNSDAFKANSIGSSTNPVDGKLKELIIYTTDQTDNRTAIEANIGSVYNIDLPDGFDPTNDKVDGFVETWYDQSGNGNDVTQATAANQPKIVNAGALVVDSGIGGLDFDGDDFLTASSVSGLEGSISMFAVSVRDATGYVVSPSNSSSGAKYFGIQEGASTSVANPRNTSSVTVSDSVSGADRLTFAVTTGATSTSVGANGSAVTTTTSDYGDNFAGSDIDQIAIGILRTVSASGQFNGRIREILVYSSDQTDNRTALETNINGHYSIF